jgi:TetR/AcrR family transcriptional repressor of nem operon
MPRTANPQTKEKLLNAAESLMLRKGFAAASVDQICAAASLTKGSFFHYFKSKEQLGAEAVKRFYERGQAMFRAAPYRKLPDPLQRIYGHCDMIIEMAGNPKMTGGCLVGTIAQEMAASDQRMRRVCADCFADWTNDLMHDMELARREHAPRARWDAASLAQHCIAVIEGALILVKSTGNGRPLADSASHLKRYLELLFEGNA